MSETTEEVVEETTAVVEEVVEEATPVVETDPVAALTADLQRLQAEYANYRKRVERDRTWHMNLQLVLFLLNFLQFLMMLTALSSTTNLQVASRQSQIS